MVFRGGRGQADGLADREATVVAAVAPGRVRTLYPLVGDAFGLACGAALLALTRQPRELPLARAA